ncbi:MAG: dodecin [Acidimicrobiales bacterium]
MAESSPIYRIVEVTGTSSESVTDAIANAVTRASKTLRNLDWFNVEDIRGRIAEDGSIASFQVTSKIGFRLEEPD